LVDVFRDLPWWPSVLRIRQEWRTSPESLIEWLYGRDDVRSESFIPVVGSGVRHGAEVVELSKGLQAFFSASSLTRWPQCWARTCCGR